MRKLMDYPDYSVTSDGVVISHKGEEDLILRQYNVNGYKRVRICGKNVGVHRLVAFAYIENPDNKPMINHLDGNKTNNTVENLEWCTAAENNKHAREILGIKTYKIEVRYGRDNWGAKRVAQIGSDGVVIEVFDCIRHAAKSLGKKPQGISKCANGWQKTSHGYLWRFLDHGPQFRRVSV